MNNALTVEPQIIHRRDDAVVVISQKEYEHLQGKTISFKRNGSFAH